MKQHKVGLFDLDIFAYQAASAVEREIDWGDGLWTLHSDFNHAKANAEDAIERIADKLKLDEIVLCITDDHNWRKNVFPEYKSNRKDVRKPLALRELKEYLISQYESFKRPGLEADDVMGILSTWSHFKPDSKKIIISEDKDLRNIPGWLFNPAKDTKPQLISREDADLWFYTQALIGDATDGYPGCPGVGQSGADELFSTGMKWESYEHEFKSGPRKGTTETRWRRVENEGSLWDAVVSCYVKAGLSENVAIQQARVARILRAEDYDFRNKQPILWSPK